MRAIYTNCKSNMEHVYYLVVFACIVSVATQEAVIQINTKKPAYYVSDKFISFSIDAQHIFGDRTSSAKNLGLVRMLSPAYVRVSSVPSTKISSEYWKEFHELMTSSGLSPMIALDYNGNNWQPREVIDFLGMSRNVGLKDCVWQLGQDMNTSSVQKYSEDIQTLDYIVDVMTSSGRWGNWRVAASDMEFDWEDESNWKKMRSYFSKIGPKVNVITVRSGQSSDEDSLEQDSGNENEALHWAYSQQTDMWLSRHPAVVMEGNHGCCESCIGEGLRYARSLGEAARHGYSVILQDLKLSSIAPNMEFFIALLHKQLMGQAVLDTVTIENDDELAFFYAHCTANVTNETAGSITVFGINMDIEELTASAKFNHRPKEGEILEYVLQVKDNKMLINGEPANMNKQPFPNIRAVRPKKSITFVLPPKSVGFWIVPANSKACVSASTYPREFDTNTRKLFKLRRTSAAKLLEELILESLNSNNFKFIGDLTNEYIKQNIKIPVNHDEDSPEQDSTDQSNNEIACGRKEGISANKYNKKQPLSKLMSTNNKDAERGTSNSDEEKDKNRRKRDVSFLKKSPFKLNQESNKNLKKTFKLSRLSKKNSAERNLFQEKIDQDFPTGDIFAGMAPTNDYEYVDADDIESPPENGYFDNNYQTEDLDGDDGLFNMQQRYTDASNFKSNILAQANRAKKEFIELGALYTNPLKEDPEFIPSFSRYTLQRIPRSIQDKSVNPKLHQIRHSNKDIPCLRNSKKLSSKRKQKLYKKAYMKKLMSKKCFEPDGDKHELGSKNYEEHILSNDITKATENTANRAKRSLKSKKRKTPPQYKSKKVKRETETAVPDAQADKPVQGIQAADDKATAKSVENTGLEVINSSLSKMKNTLNKNYAEFQNHLKQTKDRTESVLDINNYPKFSWSILPGDQGGQKEKLDLNVEKPILNLDILKNLPHFDHQLLNKNTLKHTDYAGIKSLEPLQPLAQKINKDIYDLKARLDELVHKNKPQSNLELQIMEDSKIGMDNIATSQKRQVEMYHPSVGLAKPRRNKRKPLYIEHKRKIETKSSEKIDAEHNKVLGRQKRAIDETIQSTENMIFSNSIEQTSDELSDQSPDEIVEKIILIKDSNNIDVPSKIEKETVIIENGENGNRVAEEIVSTNIENGTMQEASFVKDRAFPTNIIDDMTHTISNFVTYLHSKIKHWWS